MTNDDYIQWEPLIKKVAYKYRNNIFNLEIEDLIQIGAIGLMYAFNNYKEDKGASQKTYFYNCIEWRIIREFTNLNRVKRFCDSPVIYLEDYTDEEEGTTIADIIPSDLNVEEKVLSEIKVKQYIDEIEKHLKGIEKDVIMYKLFDDLTTHEIALACNITDNRVNTVYCNARRRLKHKSYLIATDYYKMLLEKEMSINKYRDPKTITSFKFKIEGYKNIIKARNKKNNSNKYST